MVPSGGYLLRHPDGYSSSLAQIAYTLDVSSVLSGHLSNCPLNNYSLSNIGPTSYPPNSFSMALGPQQTTAMYPSPSDHPLGRPVPPHEPPDGDDPADEFHHREDAQATNNAGPSPFSEPTS